MYKLLKIDNDAMTRMIQLQNNETGTVEYCFDDSAMTSTNNFDFMQIGNEYSCKILLFGKLAGSNESLLTTEYKIIGKEKIGKRVLTKVRKNKDVYYIDELDMSNSSQKIAYCTTRKDIIQVNNVVHADLL
ncbi:MAG: hypothetical protein ACC608_00260 [Anaerofustis sp.]